LKLNKKFKEETNTAYSAACGNYTLKGRSF